MEILDLFKSVNSFSDHSKVWVYYSDRPFTESEEKSIHSRLEHFISSWNTHGDAVKGQYLILFNQMIVIIADESVAKVSGCSIDSSVRVIQELAETMQLNFFNRNMIYFIENQQFTTTTLTSFVHNYSLENKDIKILNPYYNDLQDLKTNLAVSIQDSKFFPLLMREKKKREKEVNV